jgi:hypothetical protein
MVPAKELTEGLERLRKAFPGGRLEKGTIGVYASKLQGFEVADFRQGIETTIETYEGIWPAVAVVLRFAREAGERRLEAARNRAQTQNWDPRGGMTEEEIEAGKRSPEVMEQRSRLRAILAGVADAMNPDRGKEGRQA